MIDEFKWVSDRTPSKSLKRIGDYKSFVSHGITYKIDDYVLIRNDDCIDPEDIFTCYIAQIKDLYEIADNEEPYRAKVKWFSRISDLPSHCRKSFDQISDFEVVEDNRTNWSKEVDAETIFDKCEIVYASDESPEHDSEDGTTVFICRYKLDRNKLCLIYKDCVSACNSPSTKEFGKKEKQYQAISIGSPEFPKVLIKRIDDKILESQNENIRILVARPDTKSIEDVTKNLDDLTLFSPSTRKRPYIHSLGVHSICSDEVEDFESLHPSKSNEVSTPRRSSSRLQNCTPKKLDSEEVDCMSPSARKITKICKQSAKINISSPSNRIKDKSIQQRIQMNVASPSKISKTPRRLNFSTDDGSPISRSGKKMKLPASPLKCSPSLKHKTAQNTAVSSLDKVSKISPQNIKTYGISPSKAGKTPRRLDFSSDVEYSVTRSGRKVKSIVYTEKDVFNEEFKKSAMSAANKGLSKFIRTIYSDDSGSESAFNEDSSSESDDSMSDCPQLDLKHSKKCQKCPAKEKRSNSKNRRNQNKTLNIPDRKTPLKGPQNSLEESRLRLHVSAVPPSLPCREEEYSDIYNFVKGCLCSQTGGCMYISGVPGTGKTATVHEVMRNLEKEKENGNMPLFTFVEVNGMKMTDPYQCYVHIFKSLTGKTIASQQAANLLEKRFAENGPKKDAVVLLVDELDRLWTRKQTVLYNIFDWPSKRHSKLIVLAIANTMDLPERLMMNRISSRLGLTRKIFQPYNFKQLQEIILSRIQELKVFDGDAVQFVARKVAAVSGDARRALDICRHATELVEQSRSTPKKRCKVLVGMEHVDKAIQQMFSSPIISFIRCSSKLERLFFQCILADFNRTGSEETNLFKVSEYLVSSCKFEGLVAPNTTEILKICARLVHSHLILVDNFRNGLYMKIRLNSSPDDVNYALTGRAV